MYYFKSHLYLNHRILMQWLILRSYCVSHSRQLVGKAIDVSKGGHWKWVKWDNLFSRANAGTSRATGHQSVTLPCSIPTRYYNRSASTTVYCITRVYATHCWRVFLHIMLIMTILETVLLLVMSDCLHSMVRWDGLEGWSSRPSRRTVDSSSAHILLQALPYEWQHCPSASFAC